MASRRHATRRRWRGPQRSAGHLIPTGNRPMHADPAMLSAVELQRLYRTRQLSPVETTRAVLGHHRSVSIRRSTRSCLVDEERALARRSGVGGALARHALWLA